MKVTVLIFVALVVIMQIDSTPQGNGLARSRRTMKKHDWDYRKHGPATWAKIYPKCSGSKQSPINIVTSEITKSSSKNLIVSHNYQKKPGVATYGMENNGHTLVVKLPENTVYFLHKGNKKYIPKQIHIHFDPIHGQGSEHTLNSHKYFSEIHIVHKNAHNSNDLLVIGIFVDLVKSHNNPHKDLDYKFDKSVDTWEKYMASGTSFAMSMITYGAEQLKTPGSKINLSAFPLGWILPVEPMKNINIGYVNYKGSLTTPPCSEIVDWIVITDKKLEMNSKFAGVLKKVSDLTKHHMAGNNRPVQALNHRVVYGAKETI